MDTLEKATNFLLRAGLDGKQNTSDKRKKTKIRKTPAWLDNTKNHNCAWKPSSLHSLVSSLPDREFYQRKNDKYTIYIMSKNKSREDCERKSVTEL